MMLVRPPPLPETLIPQVPRRNSDLLLDLDRLARAMLANPATAFQYRDELKVLREEVAAAIRRPVEDERTIDDIAAMLSTALLRATDESRYSKWLDVANSLLLWVRKDARRAVDLELQQLCCSRRRL